MTLEAVRHPTLTVEEYLALEEASDVRHEYVAGVVYALAGTSKRHNRITLNIARLLMEAAEARACRVYMIDVKLRTDKDVIYYPDVMVACGPESADPLIEDAPCLVVEVASPSTTIVDQREKLVAYKRVPTVEAYLIVEQDRRRVHRFWRDASGVWSDDEVVGHGDVPIPCPPTTLRLDEIYAGTEAPPA